MVKPAAVSQGSLSVRVDENTETTQGTTVVSNGDQTVALPEAVTNLIALSRPQKTLLKHFI